MAATVLSWFALGVAAVQNPSPMRNETTVITAEQPAVRARQDELGFSDAVIAGDTIYISGVVVALQPGEADLAAAFDRAYDRIGGILERAGASWGDVVNITSYHTDITAQFPAMSEVQHRYLEPPFPAWTAIEVSRLLPDQGLTEIQVTAHRTAAADAGGEAR